MTFLKSSGRTGPQKALVVADKQNVPWSSHSSSATSSISKLIAESRALPLCVYVLNSTKGFTVA